MHLRQPGFTYSACVLFTKNKERMKKIEETGDSKYIYENELDKAYFQHDMTYGDFKDLNRRTAADKVLPKNPQNKMSIDVDLLQWSVIILIKMASAGTDKNGNISNKELAEELHKPIIRKFNKRKIHSPFTDNICGADLADMQLMSKFNKGFRFLLCVIVIYRKYALVIPLKDKKGTTITNAFQRNLD